MANTTTTAAPMTQAEAAGMAVPSKARLIRATLISLLVAAFIFVAFVLPAETGKDPLHTGALTGLTSLAQASPVGGGSAPAEERQAPIVHGVFVAQPASYKIDSRELDLAPGSGMEIKYHLQQGGAMVYSWTASDTARYEFHGEPDVKPAGAGSDYYESYDNEMGKGKGAKSVSGSFIAPTTGIHGWFWENLTDQPMKIKLVTAGFYDYVWQNKDDVKTKLPPSDPQ